MTEDPPQHPRSWPQRPDEDDPADPADPAGSQPTQPSQPDPPAAWWDRPGPPDSWAPQQAPTGGQEPSVVLFDRTGTRSGPAHALPPQRHRAAPRVAPRRVFGDDEPRSYATAMLWTVLGAIVPGAGLLKAGRKTAGIAALVVTAAVIAGLAYVASDRQTLFAVALTPAVLKSLTIGLVTTALLWAALVTATHLALRPRRSSRGQRLGGAALVMVLVFGITAPMAVAARYSYDQATLVTTVFTEQQSQTRPSITPGTKDDPWLNVPRVNLLLVGTDDSQERKYGDSVTNTDTMILASIDTRSGNTVLAGVPRNSERMPFPKDSPLAKAYPYGWPGLANAIFANLPQEVDPNILGPTSSLGADALKLAVGEALGVRVDYYVMVDLDGLYTLVNALGGVTVNVNRRLPVGGDRSRGILPSRYIEPGANKRLNADDAMWFARSRYDSDDYDRMARQRCLILGIVKQADPATMLTRYEAIAKAGSKMVRTDIPAGLLPMFVELSLRVKNADLFGITFSDATGWWVAANPDYARMRAEVAAAIKESTAAAQPTTGTPATTAASAPSSTTAPAPAPATTRSSAVRSSATSGGASPSPTAVAQNQADACAYTAPASGSASATKPR